MALTLKNSNFELRNQFLKWQCRVRQISCRTKDGRPSAAMIPTLEANSTSKPTMQIITILNKLPDFSNLCELKHIALRTNDPNERRTSALKFLSEVYYQNALQFSDVLTATFPPYSKTAQEMVASGHCALVYEQFNQRYNIQCSPFSISTNKELHAATYWHNFLFNPALPTDVTIIGFEPNWELSAYQATNSQ